MSSLPFLHVYQIEHYVFALESLFEFSFFLSYPQRLHFIYMPTVGDTEVVADWPL